MTARYSVRIESAIVLLTAMLFLLLGAPSAGAQGCEKSSCYPLSVPGGESLYQICTPEPGCLNGGLVVFAHGYLAPGEPLQIPDYELDGRTLPEIVNELGFVYATSSFPENGLAIQEGIADLVAMTTYIMGTSGLPGPVYLAGASEGGAITALAMERHPDVFSGGLALCGPVGNFQRQVNHYGDFRVVFDYFFPGVLPGTVIDPDPDGLVGPPYPPVREYWDTWYVPRIALALQADPAATQQLLKVMRIQVDPGDPVESIGEAVVRNLWYNVFATYDARVKLDGQPFDNRWRFYTGSSNDFLLNLKVKRYRADYLARLKIAADYETSGRLDAPVVTMHTTGDPIVPYWHELYYRWKTFRSGSGAMHCNLPVFAYGHCEFTADEAVTAFSLLAYKVGAQGR
jgi:pimeloyl-ACP methyl ester carboxylesterase